MVADDGEVHQKFLPLSIEDEHPEAASKRGGKGFLSFLGKKSQHQALPVALPQSEPGSPLSPSARVLTTSPLHSAPQTPSKETFGSGRDALSGHSASMPTPIVAIADSKPAMLEGESSSLLSGADGVGQAGWRRRIKVDWARQ
jgi:hypothetical protein